MREHGLPESAKLLRQLKSLGFSDARLATLVGAERGGRAGAAASGSACIRSSSASTPAPPSSPRRPPTCIRPTRRRSPARRRTRRSPRTGSKVIILGGGPNRIGQGIEFDYCCCHAAFALEEAGFESIMVNCNPETVSTDYDTSDRLYFEPLTAEDVLEIVRVEQSRGELLGVIVQFGGQTPLKLAGALQEANVPILGTSPDAIDLAEDRDRFKTLLEAARAAPAEERHRPLGRGGARRRRADRLPGGDPPLLRARRPRHGDRPRSRPAGALHERTARRCVSGTSPVLIDRYLSDAIEVDVDALSRRRRTSSSAA